jgi:hypothetical protein
LTQTARATFPGQIREENAKVYYIYDKSIAQIKDVPYWYPPDGVEGANLVLEDVPDTVMM